MRNIALTNKRLEIRAIFHSIGRIEIDHLRLSAHAFIFEQGVHDLQRVAQDQTVRPRDLCGVGIQLVGDVELVSPNRSRLVPGPYAFGGSPEWPGWSGAHGRTAAASALKSVAVPALPAQLRKGLLRLRSRAAHWDSDEKFSAFLPTPAASEDCVLALLRRFGQQGSAAIRRTGVRHSRPREFRREAGIVAIGLRGFLVRELCLDADIRPLDGNPACACKRMRSPIFLRHRCPLSLLERSPQWIDE